MRKFLYFASLVVLFLQIQKNEAKLAAVPHKHSLSACLGDTVDLKVEISQSEGLVSITWKHGQDLLVDPDHYSLSEEGRRLTILDILPPQSGLYYAQVRDGKSSIDVGFTVDVKDIFLRLGTKNPVKIPIGGAGKLEVSRSRDGVLWWVHSGQDVKTKGHFHIQGATRNILEIKDAQPLHAGIYEVILKSGSCEKRNLMQVNVGDYTTALNTSQELFDKDTIFKGIIALLSLVLASVGLCIMRTRLERLVKEKTSLISKSPGNEEANYDVEEEIIYEKEHKYESIEDLNIKQHHSFNHNAKFSENPRGSIVTGNGNDTENIYEELY